MAKILWRQYCSFTAEALQPQPFNIQNPEWQLFADDQGRTVKSMLSLGEAALCYALARDHWTGAGEIVDCGCLMGLSTRAFAMGVTDNVIASPCQKDHARIWSYDLFLTEYLADDYLRTTQAKGCGSVFGDFLAFNRDYFDLIEINPGDILRHRWAELPIEIAFVDVAKTMELNDWILQQVFTRLMSGAYLLQQDFVYDDQWWIAGTMEYFHEFFEVLDYCWGATALFQLKQLTEKQLAKFHQQCRSGLSHLSPKDWQQLLERSESRQPNSIKEMIRLGRAKMLRQNGFAKESDALVASVTGRQFTQDPYLDFSNLIRVTKERVLGAC